MIGGMGMKNKNVLFAVLGIIPTLTVDEDKRFEIRLV